jgi:membrane protein
MAGMALRPRLLARLPVAAVRDHANLLRREAIARWYRLPANARRPLRVGVKAARAYGSDNCTVLAAGIAYFAVFSLVPLTVVVLSMAGLIVDRREIVSFVLDELPLEHSPSVQEDVETLVRRAQRVSVASLSIGLLVLFWTGSQVFTAVRQSLNVATHSPVPRLQWRARFGDIGLMLALAILVVVSMALTVGTQILLENSGDFGIFTISTEWPATVSSFILPALVTFALFFVLYAVVPARRLPLRDALLASVLASIAFEAVKNAWAIFTGTVATGSAQAVYATFGAVFALMIWAFVNATILLYCAQVARVVGEERRGATGPGSDAGAPIAASARGPSNAT